MHMNKANQSLRFHRTGSLHTLFFAGAVVFLLLTGASDAFGAAQASQAAGKDKDQAVEYVDKLPGVFYDLKQTSDGKTTYLLEMQEGRQFNRLRTMVYVWNLSDTSGTESVMVPFLKRFVVSNWPYRTDSAGNLFYREFSQFFRSPVNPDKSYFYQPLIPSESAPKTFSGDESISNAGWIGINSGYVIAPFTGKFRFVGYGNDALVVRFDSQIVLDYGIYALSIGKKLDDTWDYKAILGGTAARTDPQNRMVLNNPVYSRCKLETYFPSLFGERGVAKGVPISVTRGRCYPIEILVSDIEQNQFGTALFIERLDSDGVPLNSKPEKLPLFRTSSQLPEHASGSFPDFDENSPVWNVVDRNGKPIPVQKPAVAEETKKPDTKKTEPDAVVSEKKEDTEAASELIVTTEKDAENASGKQPPPKRDPNLRKSVTTVTQDNVTTQTTMEYQGDTTIETVTTTEVNGNTTVQTTVTTETKNGVVVKKTTSTSTTVTETR